MASVRNSPAITVARMGHAASATDVRDALAAAVAELAKLKAEGKAGGFLEGAPKTEVASLTDNMRKLDRQDRDIRALTARIAEGRGRGADVEDLKRKLAVVVAQAQVVRGIVERQRTIEYLWSEPHPAYARKAAEVRELESRLLLTEGP